MIQIPFGSPTTLVYKPNAYCVPGSRQEAFHATLPKSHYVGGVLSIFHISKQSNYIYMRLTSSKVLNAQITGLIDLSSLTWLVVWHYGQTDSLLLYTWAVFIMEEKKTPLIYLLKICFLGFLKIVKKIFLKGCILFYLAIEHRLSIRSIIIHLFICYNQNSTQSI